MTPPAYEGYSTYPGVYTQKAIDSLLGVVWMPLLVLLSNWLQTSLLKHPLRPARSLETLSTRLGFSGIFCRGVALVGIGLVGGLFGGIGRRLLKVVGRRLSERGLVLVLGCLFV